jgi:mitochondrial cardiolipin hydrolase
MKEIIKLINSSFERKILTSETKKTIKDRCSSLKQEDINYLVKMSFDLFRKHQKPVSKIFLFDWFRKYQKPTDIIFLTDCLENICNTLYSTKVSEKAPVKTSSYPIEKTSTQVSTKAPEKSLVKGVYFSSEKNCTEKVIEFLDSAKTELLICVFTISDDRISQNIILKHRRGVKVKIISDNEKLLDTGSDVKRLAEAGIPVKIDKTEYHMHHKFAIADNKTLLTGSFNWTRSAAEYNEENIILLSDDLAINRFKSEFDRLWRTSKDL